MKSSRSTRFGAFVASAFACSLALGIASAASTATVYAQDAVAWHPETVAIDPGGTVTWENRDPNYPHTVECDQSSSNTSCPWSGAPRMEMKPSLGAAHTVSISFPKAGTFAYYCSIHPNMTGTVVVGSGHPPPSSTPSSTPRQSTSAKPTTHASATPTRSSVAPSASKSKGATKPGSTARATTSAAPSVLAAGPTAAKSKGPSAGVAVPAAVLIAIVGAAHVVRARHRNA